METGKTLTKKQLVRKCKSILKKDKNCVDNLPLDEDILGILVKTGIFKSKKISKDGSRGKRGDVTSVIMGSLALVSGMSPDDLEEDDEVLEEPSVFSSESEYNEYGYELAAREALPDFVNSCINIAVDLQMLRNTESEAYNDNKKFDKERIELIDKIDALRKIRNKLYEEVGSTFDLADDDIEKAIKTSDKGLNPALVSIGRITSLKDLSVGTLGAVGLGKANAVSLGIDTSDFTALNAIYTFGSVRSLAMGGLASIFGMLLSLGIYSYLVNRKKRYIMDGMIEAEEFFGKTLLTLRKHVKKPRVKALKAIQVIKGDIVGILADIGEANLIISQLNLEITALKQAIELEEG